MDAITLLSAAALAAFGLLALRGLRGRRRINPLDRIDFELHKSQELGKRGLAGRF